MKTFICMVLIGLALAMDYDLTMEHKALFRLYVQQNNVQFKSQEDRNERFAVFSANVDKIKQLNSEAVTQGRSTRFALNKYALLSEEEFRAMMLNSKMPDSWLPGPDARIAPLASQSDIDGLPTSWDWRTKTPPVVTPVKNQGACGSCYTFSTTGNIEGVWALAGHPLVSLSEQNLMDCDHVCIKGVCDGGCNGGMMANAFTWIIQSHGIESEADYPYEMENGKCRFNPQKIAASITNFTFIDKTAVQMQVYLFKNGPISIAADATMWQFYYSGVWYFPCGTSLDHGILIVGWGVETDILGQEMPYWIVKNSWGGDWGLNGYILIERGDNRCGLQQYPIASYITSS